MGRLIPAGTGLGNYAYLNLEADRPEIEFDEYPMEEGPILPPAGLMMDAAAPAATEEDQTVPPAEGSVSA